MRSTTAAVILLAVSATTAHAIVSSNTGLDISTVVGADRFYSAGYTGTRSVVANIEAGTIWSGHESLAHVTTKIFTAGVVGTRLGEADRHATWVGQTINGRGALTKQRGIAFGATLWSGAISDAYNGTPFTTGFGWSNGSYFSYPYVTAMQDGIADRKADVINSSWGAVNTSAGVNSTSAGSRVFDRTIDGLANANGTTFVVSAGNSGPSTNTVGAPGSAFNGICVGALAGDGGATPYTAISNFSSRGLSYFYNPQNGLTYPDARATVDLVAPGDSLTLALYGGTTGGNFGGTDSTAGATNQYSTNTAGTSFAAPIVASGAALLCDVGYDRFASNAKARDGRVIKSVLQNAADKIPAWNNQLALDAADGALRTKIGLDPTSGSGALNLRRAFDQYTAGTTDLPGLTGGTAKNLGWDYGQVASGTPTDYRFIHGFDGGATITATLNWFIDRTYVSTSATGSITATDDSFDDLDLQLWKLNALSAPTTLVAESAALFNNVEHFSFTLPSDGRYLLRVVWKGERYDLVSDADLEQFGLAWSGSEISDLGGDADVNGTVNFDDLIRLAQNYNKTSGQLWANGDFNDDRAVNFDDLIVLAQHYNTSAGFAASLDGAFAADWAFAQSLVPEPTTLTAALAFTTLARRRR